MRITVGTGSCGIAAGAAEVFDLLTEGLAHYGLNHQISATGCIGMCYLEPIVNIESGEDGIHTFVKVNAAAVEQLIKYLLGQENSAQAYAIAQEDLDNLHAQQRIALQNCGIIDPENIAEYMGCQGYGAARKCLTELSPEQVIEEIKISGLSGRGGAGVPAWVKGQAARTSAGEQT
jgi:NADH-quinone oxidoreductase subunit F